MHETGVNDRFKRYRLLNRMSITTRFTLSIGLLLFLIVTVAAAGYLAMDSVRVAGNSINTSNDILKLVLEMDHGMEKARRLHGDFFLQYPRIGLAKAHELYAQPSARQIARVITDSDELKALAQKVNIGDAIHKAHVDLNLYLSFAKRFADTSIQSVELVTELAAPERGLESQLANCFKKLHDAIADNRILTPLFVEMRDDTQEYRISRKRYLMQSAYNVAFRIHDTVANMQKMTPAAQKTINDLLDQFMAITGKMVSVDVAIRARFNDFALQSETAGRASAALVRAANEQVAQARNNIAHVQRTGIIIMTVTTLIGLLAALGIAENLNAAITRRILRLTRTTEAMKNGDLTIVADETGTDELSRLGQIFNRMSVHLREALDTLEKRVEQRTSELADSERRFRQFFENSPSGISIYTPLEDGIDFTLRDINRAGERIDKVKRQDIIGKKVTEIYPGIVEMGLLDIFRAVWQTGLPARNPASFYSDDRLSRWFENTVFRFPSGEIASIFNDITEQKQAETEKDNMEARLYRAQKMESLGLLAGGVAHDLNNILSGIVGYPELLLMQLPPDSELRAPIKAIQESGQRAVAVVADLLTIARGVASVKKITHLNDLVMEYLDSPEHRKLTFQHTRVVCHTQLDPSLAPINCSQIHIRKCIMNLVSNAMEAIDSDGSVVISTRNRKLDDASARDVGLPPGNYVILEITDDGRGISPKDMEHIFEPFYTRKVMGISGTGLGLAVAWNCVQDHGGTVQVTSRSQESSGDHGTSFYLYFPAASDTDAVREPPQNELDNIRGNGETILVVDDEPIQLDIACQMLTAMGYTASCANSGEKALAYIQEHEVNLVLLDMIMDPGINGRQTYEQMIRIRPGQKVVIASGYSESTDVRKAQQLGARGFLKKPYTMEQLGRMIQEALL